MGKCNSMVSDPKSVNQSTESPAQSSQTQSFYPLTREELIRLKQQLTFSEFSLYLYIKTINPFGDRYEALDIEQAMTDLDLSKASFYRAVGTLLEKELIDCIAGKMYVRDLSSQNKIVSPMRLKSHRREKSLTREKKISPMRLQSHPCEFERSEPAPQADPGSPHTIQTDQTDQTNQIKKREEEVLENDPAFIRWINRGLDALPKPPQGHYRHRLLKRELEDKINQKLYQELTTGEEATSSAPESQQILKICEMGADAVLEAQIKIRQGMWSNPNLRGQIRAWCQQMKIVCTAGGPQLPAGHRES